MRHTGPLTNMAPSNFTKPGGGYGFTLEFDIQRHMRDARLFVIGDGSSQIQRNLIARLMGL
jgi:alkylation response protein AidB-like acyl-CoA dehydrogenase